MPLPPWLDALDARINEYFLIKGDMADVPVELLSVYTQGLYAEGLLQDAEEVLGLNEELFRAGPDDLRARNALLRYSVLNTGNQLAEAIPADVWVEISERISAAMRK